jgi:hypothetical protein
MLPEHLSCQTIFIYNISHMMPTRKAGEYAQDTIRFTAKIFRRIFHIMKYKSIGVYISIPSYLGSAFSARNHKFTSQRGARGIFMFFDTEEGAICVKQRGSMNNLVS